jgi:methylthioribose-1-phosphate isomerase
MATGLEAIKYTRGSLEVLDQLRLPYESHFDKVSTCAEAFDCIKSMRVRGAPAIAIVAALALAVELSHEKDGKLDSLSVLALFQIFSTCSLPSQPQY